MASSVEEEDSLDSIKTQDSVSDTNSFSDCCVHILSKSNQNVITKLTNRQIYGRITQNPRSKTGRIFDGVYCKCRFSFSDIIPHPGAMDHIFMGFTICGQFFLTYTMNESHSNEQMAFLSEYEYELYVWRFIPSKELHFITKHRIFKLLSGTGELEEVRFMQFPSDPYKVICYALGVANHVAFLTILTLPTPKICKSCKGNRSPVNDKLARGWCLKHGFILHYMVSTSQPAPAFNPDISLAFPDHLVINTGHYVHILNISTYEHPPPLITLSNFVKDLDCKLTTHANSNNLTDSLSEISESASEYFGTGSAVDSILEDFNEYDFEGNDCNKPFHELNISCEPLNVTGRNYNNTVIQSIVDPRLKRIQSTSKDYLFPMPQTSALPKPVEKTKIDKKIAEKAYEFTEETEKCEKLSSFRKKRLADKKYEFSEDNSENIIPFNVLRRERRCLHKAQSKSLRSPDYANALFLGPRSPGIRSPMQSPNSRHGQFSPGGARNLYCPVIRNSPYHSKSPISPKEATRKFNVYSPVGSDCSDYDSKLILRQVNSIPTLHCNDKPHSSLLIVDTKKDDAPRWIKKIVRRYSSGDYEHGSLVSGQSRDDYNIAIELPILVQTLTEQQLDIVSEFKPDQTNETQLIVTQRTFDCEQFVQRRAQKLCAEAKLEFLHCEDYDIKIIHVCPLNGHIICKAVIKICALQAFELCSKPHLYSTSCICAWNIASDAFEVIEPPEDCRLQLNASTVQTPNLYIPPINSKRVLVLDHLINDSKLSLRDYNNFYEIRVHDILCFIGLIECCDDYPTLKQQLKMIG